MEKLTMVKRRLKHALHAMEPAGSIPAIHKADQVTVCFVQTSGIFVKLETNRFGLGIRLLFLSSFWKSNIEFQEGSHHVGLIRKISRRRKNTKEKEDVSSFFDSLAVSTDTESLGGAAPGGGSGGSSCSSPEHPTVARRPSLTSSRGPPVQQERALFNSSFSHEHKRHYVYKVGR